MKPSFYFEPNQVLKKSKVLGIVGHRDWIIEEALLTGDKFLSLFKSFRPFVGGVPWQMNLGKEKW